LRGLPHALSLGAARRIAVACLADDLAQVGTRELAQRVRDLRARLAAGVLAPKPSRASTALSTSQRRSSTWSTASMAPVPSRNDLRRSLTSRSESVSPGSMTDPAAASTSAKSDGLLDASTPIDRFCRTASASSWQFCDSSAASIGGTFERGDSTRHGCSPTSARKFFRRDFRPHAEIAEQRRAHTLGKPSNRCASTRKENCMNAKQMIRCASAVSLALALSTAYAADTDTQATPMTGKEKATAIGAGTGAVAGAVVGGPVGAVVGGVAAASSATKARTRTVG
jgi:hypothetical protein